MNLNLASRPWAQFAGLGRRSAVRAAADGDPADDRAAAAAPDNGNDGDTTPRDDGQGARTARRADGDPAAPNENDPNGGHDGDTDPAELRRCRNRAADDDYERYADPDDDTDPAAARRARRARADDDDFDAYRADGDEGGDDADRPDADDEGQGARRGARRARADGDPADEDDGADDDAREMRGRSAVASARRRERARCAAILGSRHAAGKGELAASLAFDTTMTRREATRVLRQAKAGAVAASPGERRNPQLGPGGERNLTGPQAIGASWDRALAKAGATQSAPTGGMEALLQRARAAH